MDTFRKDVQVEIAKLGSKELLQAVTEISLKVHGGIDIIGWGGKDTAWKAKWVDTLLMKIAGALKY